MLYLESFRLPTREEEEDYLLSYPYQQEMQCYSHENVYPFHLFPEKSLSRITFEPITVFYLSPKIHLSPLRFLYPERFGSMIFCGSAPVREPPMPQ